MRAEAALLVAAAAAAALRMKSNRVGWFCFRCLSHDPFQLSVNFQFILLEIIAPNLITGNKIDLILSCSYGVTQ